MNPQNEDLELKDEIEFEYKCIECKETFEFERDLRKHMKKHKKSSSDVNSPEMQEADDDFMIYENDSEEGNGDKTTLSSEETDTSTSARGVVKQENHQRFTKNNRARAQNHDTGNLSIKQELKLEFNCPQCDNFYSYEGDFWKHQDNLRISLSNIDCPEIQAQIIEMINNAQPKTEMETQTNEDIQLAAIETEESQKQNPVNASSRNSQNRPRRVKKTSNKSRKIIQSLRIPDVRILRNVTAKKSKRSQMNLKLNDKKLKNQSGENLKKRNVRAVASSKSKLQNQPETEESNRVLESGDMGNSEEAKSNNRVQFAYKCLTCCDIIITTKKDLWDHVNFHEKALNKSENSKPQNQLHRKESEVLKKVQDEGNPKSTKQTQKMRMRKRKYDSDAVLSPKVFKDQSGTKNSDVKQSKRTLRSRAIQQNTIEIPVTTAESNKLRYRRELQLTELNDIKKKKQNKNVPETENSTTPIDPDFDCIENDQNPSEYQEDNQLNVSANELNSSEGLVGENVNQVLRQSQENSISTIDCQVRVKFTLVYWCDNCPKYCFSKQELVEHMKNHVKEIYKSTSEGTETKAKRQNDLDRLKILFECHKCGKRFKLKGHLKTHLAIHSEARTHHCTKCEKKFKTKSNLWNHQAVHDEARPYSCKKCDKFFKRSWDLKHHQARHSKSRPYSCKTCDKSFKRSSDLKYHQAVHNEATSHKCNECTLSFKRSCDLTHHQVRHHSDLRPYSCKTCDKSFKTSSDLWSHQHVHSDVKLYKCKRCSQKFKWKGKLTKHLKTCK